MKSCIEDVASGGNENALSICRAQSWAQKGIEPILWKKRRMPASISRSTGKLGKSVVNISAATSAASRLETSAALCPALPICSTRTRDELCRTAQASSVQTPIEETTYAPPLNQNCTRLVCERTILGVEPVAGVERDEQQRDHIAGVDRNRSERRKHDTSQHLTGSTGRHSPSLEKISIRNVLSGCLPVLRPER